MRGLVRQITKWHSKSSGKTTLEQMGHLKPATKRTHIRAGNKENYESQRGTRREVAQEKEMELNAHKEDREQEE